MNKPTPEQVAVAEAEAEIKAEDQKARDYYSRPDIVAICEENARRSNLPSEDPERIHGIFCDGQDGGSSYCMRLRAKLFPGVR